MEAAQAAEVLERGLGINILGDRAETLCVWHLKVLFLDSVKVFIGLFE